MLSCFVHFRREDDETDRVPRTVRLVGLRQPPPLHLCRPQVHRDRQRKYSAASVHRPKHKYDFSSPAKMYSMTLVHWPKCTV